MAHDEQRYATPADILAALPHRPPFLFIDRVDSLELNQVIRAVKHVAQNDVCGHSAERKLPPVYLLECFGQAGVLLVAAERRDAEAKLGVYLGVVDAFDVSGEVVSGDTVEIEVRFKKRTSKLAILEGRALVHGVAVAHAEFSAYFYWKDSA